MKKFSLKFISILLISAIFINISVCSDAYAKKKGKSKGISPKEVELINTDLNNLMKKVYSSALFAPEDNAKLIEIKMKIDTAIEANPEDPLLAKPIYNVGYLSKEREFRDNAVECYKLLLENFSESNYAIKAESELKKMGIKIEVEEE